MKAVLDTCVLYPPVTRAVLIGAAEVGILTPLWSDRILAEWVHTAARHHGDAGAVSAQGDITLLNARFPSALIPQDAALQAALWLPDRNDIHVLATAITGQSDTIITLNLKDFPKRTLAPHGVSAIHPDVVLTRFLAHHPNSIMGILERLYHNITGGFIKVGLETPPPLRTLLKRAHLPRFGKAVSKMLPTADD